MKVTTHSGRHPGTTSSKLMEACGFIPYFVADAEDAGVSGMSAEEVMKILMLIYGFATDIRMEGEVQEDGTYVYPEDPDLDPYVSMKGDYGHTYWIYPYGIVAVVDKNGEQSIARMD
jgi:hypothetical protein